MHLRKLLDRFDFQRQTLVDDKVDTKFANNVPAKIHSKRNLLGDIETRFAKRQDQGVLINTFEKSIAKLVIHRIKHTDHTFGQLAFDQCFIRVHSCNPWQKWLLLSYSGK